MGAREARFTCNQSELRRPPGTYESYYESYNFRARGQVDVLEGLSAHLSAHFPINRPFRTSIGISSHLSFTMASATAKPAILTRGMVVQDLYNKGIKPLDPKYDIHLQNYLMDHFYVDQGSLSAEAFDSYYKLAVGLRKKTREFWRTYHGFDAMMQSKIDYFQTPILRPDLPMGVVPQNLGGRPTKPFADLGKTARHHRVAPLKKESPAALLTAAGLISTERGDKDASKVLKPLGKDLPGEASKIRTSLGTPGKRFMRTKEYMFICTIVHLL